MVAIVIMCIMAASFNAKAQGPDSANMEKIGNVSAYYWAGNDSAGAWIEARGTLWMDRTTGRKWVKIFHNGDRKGPLLNNRDYKGKIGLNRRLTCKYMANCDNGYTYYININ